MPAYHGYEYARFAQPVGDYGSSSPRDFGSSAPDSEIAPRMGTIEDWAEDVVDNLLAKWTISPVHTSRMSSHHGDSAVRAH